VVVVSVCQSTRSPATCFVSSCSQHYCTPVTCAIHTINCCCYDVSSSLVLKLKLANVMSRIWLKLVAALQVIDDYLKEVLQQAQRHAQLQP